MTIVFEVTVDPSELTYWRWRVLFTEQAAAEAFARKAVETLYPDKPVHVRKNNETDSLYFSGGEPLVGAACDASVFSREVDNAAEQERILGDIQHEAQS